VRKAKEAQGAEEAKDAKWLNNKELHVKEIKPAPLRLCVSAREIKAEG